MFGSRAADCTVLLSRGIRMAFPSRGRAAVSAGDPLRLLILVISAGLRLARPGTEHPRHHPSPTWEWGLGGGRTVSLSQGGEVYQCKAWPEKLPLLFLFFFNSLGDKRQIQCGAWLPAEVGVI